MTKLIIEEKGKTHEFDLPDGFKLIQVSKGDTISLTIENYLRYNDKPSLRVSRNTTEFVTK